MKLVLRPLRDADLPYLYRWNADPEVLYWTEGGEAGETLSYSPEEVRGIYGSVSQDALFISYRGRWARDRRVLVTAHEPAGNMRALS